MCCFFDDSKCTFADYLIYFEIVIQLEDRVLFLSFKHLDQLNELIACFVLVRNFLDELAAPLRSCG